MRVCLVGRSGYCIDCEDISAFLVRLQTKQVFNLLTEDCGI